MINLLKNVALALALLACAYLIPERVLPVGETPQAEVTDEVIDIEELANFDTAAGGAETGRQNDDAFDADLEPLER